MSISEPMLMSKGLVEPVRRIEVFTGAGRRRAWTGEEKARIVAESCAGDDTVCGVARRHGLTPQQLFTWRRQARRRAGRGSDDADVRAGCGGGDVAGGDGREATGQTDTQSWPRCGSD